MTIKPNDYFYGEWAFYESEEERQEAKTYLELWKKFFLRKLPSTLTFVEAQWIERPSALHRVFTPTLGLKIKVHGFIPPDLQEDDDEEEDEE